MLRKHRRSLSHILQVFGVNLRDLLSLFNVYKDYIMNKLIGWDCMWESERGSTSEEFINSIVCHPRPFSLAALFGHTFCPSSLSHPLLGILLFCVHSRTSPPSDKKKATLGRKEAKSQINFKYSSCWGETMSCWSMSLMLILLLAGVYSS